MMKIEFFWAKHRTNIRLQRSSAMPTTLLVSSAYSAVSVTGPPAYKTLQGTLMELHLTLPFQTNYRLKLSTQNQHAFEHHHRVTSHDGLSLQCRKSSNVSVLVK